MKSLEEKMIVIDKLVYGKKDVKMSEVQEIKSSLIALDIIKKYIKLGTHLEITLTLCDGGKKRIYNLYKKLNVFEEGLKR